MIDTTGVPLHKRGYRTEAGAAPLRETLAAAVAAISRPREDVLLWDPFCGSGTIAIEAALMMTNTAPGISRKFICEDFALLSDGSIAKEERAKAFAQTYQNKLRGLQAEHDITVSAAKDTIAAEKENILQSSG